ncbi:MAG: nucleotide exchange factor GrpE [Candidatus Daviesbacteria bacterium]|nr:MAG: nucleotide exchange factor GrpE [Candidatus Daviesbacteria bacterium]
MKKTDTKITDLENKVIDLENQLKRAVADYHNLEKRVSEGRSELTNFVGAELIRKLIPTLDHLETALSGVSEEEKQSGWFRGVELAVKEFKQVLESEGLGQIEAGPSTSSGQSVQFDPALHEAVDTQEGDDNIILRVVRRGYKLNGKVLRPAQVVVGRSNVIASEAKQSGSEGIASSPSAPRNDENEGDN